MNKIYNEIKAMSGGRYDCVRFSQIAFADGKATVRVVCPADRYDEIAGSKGELTALLRSACALNAPLGVEIVREAVTADTILKEVRRFNAGFPFLSSVSDKMTAESYPPSVHIVMHKSMYELAKDDYIPRLNEYLCNKFTVPINVDVRTVEYVDAVESAEKKPEHTVKKDRYYSAREPVPVIGEPVCGEAISAGDIVGNHDNVTVCGVLTMATDCMSKGSGAKRSRPYGKFVLYDGDMTLQCRVFPRAGISIAEAGIINRRVCAFGNTEFERGRTDETSMTVRALSLCEADGPEIVPSRPEPESYGVIFPEPNEEYVQASLFGDDDDLPDNLRGTFVVFDFETTGLNIMYDSPTELGAVKVVDGVIIETFSTLIDPQRPIPDDVVKKTGITDDMVRGKPIFADILPDFYKFTYGAALVGHNIAFDFPFLIKHGNRAGWAFGDRKTFDTFGMAPRALPGIAVLTLENVLEQLGLSNDNAHRALSDARATAKAFIAMQRILAKMG